jgi:hypothetical protein
MGERQILARTRTCSFQFFDLGYGAPVRRYLRKHWISQDALGFTQDNRGANLGDIARALHNPAGRDSKSKYSAAWYKAQEGSAILKASALEGPEPGIRQTRNDAEQVGPAYRDFLDRPAGLFVILPFTGLALLLHEAADGLPVAVDEYATLRIV